jgi:hypothetical protein
MKMYDMSRGTSSTYFSFSILNPSNNAAILVLTKLCTSFLSP